MESVGDATFRYALRVYDELENKSIPLSSEAMLEYGYPIEHGRIYTVFIGNLAVAGERVGITRSTIYKALALLREMRAIDQLVRGTLNKESVFLLNYRPTVEHWNDFRQSIVRIDRKINPTQMDIVVNGMAELRSMYADLSERVARLEG